MRDADPPFPEGFSSHLFIVRNVASFERLRSLSRDESAALHMNGENFLGEGCCF